MPSKPDKPINIMMEYDFKEVDPSEIIEEIRRIDGSGTAKALPLASFLIDQPDAIGLRAIKDWATKDLIASRDITVKGKKFKAGQRVRGPIADSLETYFNTSNKAEMFVWVTAIQDTSGDLDVSLDGKVFRVDDFSAPLPPLHPNCNCQREPIPDDTNTYRASVIK